MKKLLLTLLCFLLAASYTAFAAGQGGQATADDVLEYRVLMNVSKDRVPSERPSFFDKELEKRFGMRWNVEELATDSLPDTLELYWASGEDVDYFGGWAKDKVNKWGAEGFIHPAEDLLDRLPNYRKLWTDEEWAQNVMLNSGFNNVLYFLPAKGGRVIDNDGNEYDRLVTSEGWYYKKSAFDKIGLEFPETTEGLRETLRTLKKEFPDEFMGLTIRGSSDHIWTIGWIFTPAFRTYRYFLVDPDAAPCLAAHRAIIGRRRFARLHFPADLVVHPFGGLRIERFGQVRLPVQIRPGDAQSPVSLGGSL